MVLGFLEEELGVIRDPGCQFSGMACGSGVRSYFPRGMEVFKNC